MSVFQVYADDAVHGRSDWPGADGVDGWLKLDNGGVYRVASKSDMDEEPKADAGHSHPTVPFTYTIDAMDDKVQVRAGSFERFVRVGGTQTLELIEWL